MILVDQVETLDAIDRFERAVIGPEDGRFRVYRTDVSPYSAICYLERDFGGRKSGCTGTLVAPDLVLTAGHCLMGLGGRVPRAIVVQPGRNGTSIPERIPGSGIFVARRFARRRDPLFDYGIIRLARPAQVSRRPLPLYAPSDRDLRKLMCGNIVRIAGYPADKPRGTLWAHDERLRRFDDRKLIHVIDTCPGHSGSAVLAPINGRLRVIGVHVAGVTDPATGRSYGCRPGSPASPRGGVNRAVRLTRHVLAGLKGRPRSHDHALVRLRPSVG